MRQRAACLLGVCLASGCFIDAIGVAGDAGAPGSGGSTSSSESTTSGGAGQGGVSEGGGGVRATGGGGDGGAAPGCLGYLQLDAEENDRAEIAATAELDDGDDFAFGARVRLVNVPPSFVVNDGNYYAAYVFEHDDSANGFTLGFTERYDGGIQGDDGEAHAFVAVQADDYYCEARDDAAFALDAWHSIAGTYDAGSGTVTLYVDGVALDSDNDCYFGGGVSAIGAPFAIGSDGFGIEGDVDDVFLANSAALPPVETPVTCVAGMIAAFDFDGMSLATVCPGTAHTFTLLDSPADPVLVCP